MANRAHLCFCIRPSRVTLLPTYSISRPLLPVRALSNLYRSYLVTYPLLNAFMKSAKGDPKYFYTLLLYGLYLLSRNLTYTLLSV